MRALFLLISLSIGASGLAAAPLVIAHRGASGYLPEHTLEAYQAAINMGADYIEPDLVLTADGHFLARHDIYLGTTTNVADEFPERRRTLYGKNEWYVIDFTLAEVQQLRARQAFPDRSREHDNLFLIPTLEDVVKLIRRHESETGRKIGLYPELKVPTHFAQHGFDMGALLLTELKRLGVTSRVFIQSFDPETLQALSARTDLPLIMLLTSASRHQPNVPNIPLEDVAAFADGIGAIKYLLTTPSGADSGVITQARTLGLTVHAWTFSDDRLPAGFTDAESEINHYLQMGVDGIFTDFPDTGVQAVRSFEARQTRK